MSGVKKGTRKHKESDIVKGRVMDVSDFVGGNLDLMGTSVGLHFLTDSEFSPELAGCYKNGQSRIDINISTTSYESQLSTLLHEVIEAIDTSLELDLDHPQISALETCLFQALRKNSGLCEAFLYKGA